MAIDTLGRLLVLHVTLANEQDRDRVAHLALAVQEPNRQHFELAYVDQGYTAEAPEQAAQAQGIAL